VREVREGEKQELINKRGGMKVLPKQNAITPVGRRGGRMGRVVNMPDPHTVLKEMGGRGAKENQTRRLCSKVILGS